MSIFSFGNVPWLFLKSHLFPLDRDMATLSLHFDIFRGFAVRQMLAVQAKAAQRKRIEALVKK